jgi:uncharacterized membrane protein
MPGVTMPVDTRLVIGPNASLSAGQALGFFAGLSAVCLAIAGGFAWMGLWLILPFAGLELAAVGAALVVVIRRNRYREVLVFEGERLRLEVGRVGAGIENRTEWVRGLTRVILERGPQVCDPTRLVLDCGGQRRIIGRCLTDAERVALARRLKELIHPAWLAAGPAAETLPDWKTGD